MIIRKTAFVLVILFFSVIALILFADLVQARKKIDKQRKNTNAKTHVKTKVKKSYYR